MLEIAGGIVLAVIFLALLPALLRLLGYAITLAIVGVLVGVAVWAFFGLGLPGIAYIIENWSAVSHDPTFWAVMAACVVFWIWLVFVAKPDWLKAPPKETPKEPPSLTPAHWLHKQDP
jgi:hypothetical protein